MTGFTSSDWKDYLVEGRAQGILLMEPEFPDEVKREETFKSDRKPDY